jgi:hypothetical protein
MSSDDYLGDVEVVKHFEVLIKSFEDYKNSIDSILTPLKQFLIRLNALINPTSEIKIKVLSTPSSNEIISNIEEAINDMRTQVKEIANIIKEVEKISKESKIKCDKCDGEGEIYNRVYDKVDGTIQETLRGEICNKCKGRGYLYLSNTLVSHLKIIEVLKLLLIKVPTDKD